MLGLLGQADWMNEDSGRLGSNIDGQGWMAGPYLGILLGSHWQFDGRAAWGQSDNDINLLGGRGSFDTDRWLARGSLRGNWYSGAWRLTSITELGYVEEQQDSFRESGGAVVPGQTITLGRFTFGPELAYRMDANGFFVWETAASLGRRHRRAIGRWRRPPYSRRGCARRFQGGGKRRGISREPQG